MSYDLEVRSDDAYSRSASREEVIRVLEECGARLQTRDQLIFEDAARGQHVEIGVGFNVEGGEDERSASDMVNYVGLGVPYPFLDAAGGKALEISFAVAARLGWRVFDPQADSYLSPSDEGTARHTQEKALHAFDELSKRLGTERGGFIRRVLDRLLRQTFFLVFVAVLTGVVIAAYAVKTSGQSSREDPRPFVGTVLGSAIGLILLKPVVEEWLEARRRH